MAKLTIIQMLTRLSRDIEDPDNALFTTDQKVDILNESQSETVIKVPFRTLSTLFVSTVTQTIDSNSSFDLSTLTEPVTGLGLLRFPDGISQVKFTDGAVLHLMTIMELQQLGFRGFETVNLDALFSTVFPKYRIKGNDIIVIPSLTDGSLTLDFEWYREPLAMLNDTGTPANNVDCELNDYIQAAIIDWAAFKCFMIQENFNRARQSFESWANRVREINVRFPNTQSISFPKFNQHIFPGNDGSGISFPSPSFE